MIEAQFSFTVVRSESDLFYSIFWLLSSIYVYFNAQTSLISDELVVECYRTPDSSGYILEILLENMDLFL